MNTPAPFALALLVVGAVASAPSLRGVDAPVPSARPSLDMSVPVPPTPVVVDGVPRLVYELHLTNFVRDALVLRRVEVLDADGDAVIAEISGDALDVALEAPAGSSADHAGGIAPGVHGVVYLEIAVERGPTPRALEHRVSFQGTGGARATSVVRGGRVAVRPEPAPVVLGAPLRGGPWAAAYHPSWERGHRRFFYVVDGRARIPGRFAIDWVKLDANGRRARTDLNVVRDWYGYAADVLAVADAVVAATRDDVAESATLADHPDHPLEDGTGNYIALDLGGGRYAFYEHLAPGSVRVEVGRRVRRGEVIAAVGFTGHSMGPHLHFHVADASSSLGAEGRPFVLERFDVLGAYDDFAVLADVPWSPIEGTSTTSRTRELPAPNVVVDFGS